MVLRVEEFEWQANNTVSDCSMESSTNCINPAKNEPFRSVVLFNNRGTFVCRQLQTQARAGIQTEFQADA